MGLLLHFDDEAPLARRLAQAAGLQAVAIGRHRFPDGELRLRLPARLPACVVLLRGLHRPNEKLTELLLAAGAARELGAHHLTLVAPYLAYMRQDMAFEPARRSASASSGAFWPSALMPCSRWTRICTAWPACRKRCRWRRPGRFRARRRWGPGSRASWRSRC